MPALAARGVESSSREGVPQAWPCKNWFEAVSRPPSVTTAASKIQCDTVCDVGFVHLSSGFCFVNLDVVRGFVGDTNAI